jgi:acyl carrier protein
MNETQLKIYTIISEQLGIPIKDIAPEKKFVEDLGGDSLDTVEMMLTLEDRFNIEIPEEQAEQFITVQSVLDYIDQLELA